MQAPGEVTVLPVRMHVGPRTAALTGQVPAADGRSVNLARQVVMMAHVGDDSPRELSVHELPGGQASIGPFTVTFANDDWHGHVPMLSLPSTAVFENGCLHLQFRIVKGVRRNGKLRITVHRGTVLVAEGLIEARPKLTTPKRHGRWMITPTDLLCWWVDGK